MTIREAAQTRVSNTVRHNAAASFLALVSALIGCTPPTPEVVAGDAAPVFEAIALDGSAVGFPSVASGQPSVVLVWATWCPYCTAFMPELAKIQSEYADRGVNIVAINAKERGRGDPRAYIRDKGYDFITVLAGDDIAELWDVDYLPGLFVVDGGGEIVFRREWTDLPAGQKIANLWAGQIRDALDATYRD